MTKMHSDLSTVFMRAHTHQWRQADEGKILVFPRYKGTRPEVHGFYELEEFEAAIWLMLDGKNNVGQICTELARMLNENQNYVNTEMEDIRQEVTAFLEEMQLQGLIYIAPDTKKTLDTSGTEEKP